MKALICYDTKYGSTTEVCNNIKSGMQIDTEIKNIRDVNSFNYEMIIIGSPIFIGKPMKSIEDFIIDNYKKLRDKKIVIFVTCWAVATQYGRSSGEFLEQLEKYLPPCHLICKKALSGKLLLDKVSEGDRQKMKRLLRRLDAMSEEFNSQEIAWRDARDKQAAMDFGEEIEMSLKLIMRCL